MLRLVSISLCKAHWNWILCDAVEGKFDICIPLVAITVQCHVEGKGQSFANINCDHFRTYSSYVWVF